MDSRHLLRAETGRSLAEKRLAEDGNNAAAGTLATVGADVAEVADAEGNRRGRCAVQVSDTEDISSAALGVAVKTGGAGDIGGVIGGHGRDSGGDEADDSDHRGLHFEVRLVSVRNEKVEDC